MLGERLLWKKAQKNETKKKISDKINKTIPIFNPFNTQCVWNPWNEPSREISRHHWNEEMVIIKTANKIKCTLKFWKYLTKPKVKDKAEIELVIGHGLFSTKWNGWNIISLILSFINIKTN